MAASKTFSVLVHPFASKARHSCAYELGSSSARNALVVIGGLSDGPHTVIYARHLAKFLGSAESLSYSVFEFRMRSSFTGYGHSSLKNDVEDISSLVKYLRSIGKEKIVLSGHSTGCQDCMEYTNYAKNNSEPVDGFILQAPISDREILPSVMPDPQPSHDYALKLMAEGKENAIMPREHIPDVFETPLTAYRWYSLAAKGGDDDFFSSDIDDETRVKYWSRFQQPVLVLHSGSDQYAPPGVDQAEQNKKYRESGPLVSPLSGLIPGANHSIDDPEAQDWFANKVAEFLRTLE